MPTTVTTEIEEPKNILEESRLHRLMVLFQKTHDLAAAVIIILQLLSAALVGAAWWRFGADARIAIASGLILGLSTLGDAVILLCLRRRGVSFGPWKPQTVVLLLPRVVAGLVLALLAPLFGASIGFVLLVVLQIAGALLLWWGAAVEPRRLALTRLDLHLDALSPGSEAVRLLHITDIHLERFAEREERLLALVRQAVPDVILITGDFLNLSYNQDAVAKQQVAHLLQQLHAPYGVFATLGSPPVDLRREIVPLLDSLPVCVLRNEWTKVDVHSGRSLILMGVDCTHHLDYDGARLARVAAAAPNSAPRILLYHSPELMPQASRQSVDLYVCGHTHGGQVRLPFIGPLLTSSKLGRRYVMGHYRQGQTHLYVSRGIGLEGLSAPRVRLLAPPEVTLITLHSSQTLGGDRSK